MFLPQLAQTLVRRILVLQHVTVPRRRKFRELVLLYVLNFLKLHGLSLLHFPEASAIFDLTQLFELVFGLLGLQVSVLRHQFVVIVCQNLQETGDFEVWKEVNACFWEHFAVFFG